MCELIDFFEAEASRSNAPRSRGDLIAKPPRSCASEDDFSRLGLAERDAAIDNYACPFTKARPFEAKNIAARAISSGWPI